MIACFKCGHENPDGQKFCTCGAMLPQMAPSGSATSSIDLDEDTNYIKPTEHFPSAEMLAMAWALHDFLEEEGELEPFLEVYEGVKERLENYNTNLHQQSLEFIANDRSIDPEDTYPKQVQYLIVRGSQLSEEGITLVEKFLDALDQDRLEGETGKEGVAKIVQANDHFLLALHMSMSRADAIRAAAKANGVDLDKQMAESQSQ
ncbi:hypothetical protein JST97_34395 [bacterium]|nr:hypothetical protein [bacterium]